MNTNDTAGRVLTKTNGNGSFITYTYDVYGRVTQINRSGGIGFVEPDPLTTFSYDASDGNTYLTQQNLLGRLAKITHGFGTVERFSYTVSGRLAAKTLSPQDGKPFIGTFSYDNEGRLTTYAPSGVYSSGGTAIQQGTRQWTYDALGRPLALTYYDANSVATALTANAVYNSAGQIKSYVRAAVLQYNAGNDLAGVYQSETLNFSFNALGQVVQQSGGSWAPNIQYQYSATANDGRVQSRIDQYAGGSAATSSYMYDSLGRLSSASSAGALAWGQSYVYDPFGNLLQQ